MLVSIAPMHVPYVETVGFHPDQIHRDMIVANESSYFVCTSTYDPHLVFRRRIPLFSSKNFPSPFDSNS
jgi:hypothetical protein